MKCVFHLIFRLSFLVTSSLALVKKLCLNQIKVKNTTKTRNFQTYHLYFNTTYASPIFHVKMITAFEGVVFFWLCVCLMCDLEPNAQYTFLHEKIYEKNIFFSQIRRFTSAQEYFGMKCF